MRAAARRLAAATLAVVLGACVHPTTEPREAHALRIGSWALGSADEVCAALIAHVPAGDRAGHELGCQQEPLDGTGATVLPLSIARITGARRPLAYLVHTPAEGYRRVLAAYRGEPGMAFSATVEPSTEWSGDVRLVQVATTWRGVRVARGSKSLTLCLAHPQRTDMNFPVCAFTALVERWSYTGSVGGSDQIPPTPVGPREAWAVAIDRTYGAALVIQVRGQRDPTVPTGAFLIQPPLW